MAGQGPSRPEALPQRFERWASERRIAGLAIGLLDGDSTAIITAGSRDSTPAHPITDSTSFEIGSITKAFTGTLLADMVLRGEVALDDPVSKYLPGWTIPTWSGQPITLLDLATHTSGLPRMPDNMHPANGDDPYVDYSAADFRQFLAHHQLRRQPGSAYEYSNYGMALLGTALAHRAHVSYEDLVRQRILGPLGMRETEFRIGRRDSARAAQGHNEQLEPTPPWHLGEFVAAGGLHSTVPDLLRFARAALDTVSGPLARVMAFAIRPRRPLAGSDSIGLAWHHLHLDGTDVVWHNGGTGGFRSWLGVDVAHHRAVVALANAGGGFPIDGIGVQLMRGEAPGDPPARGPQPQIAVPTAALDRLVGRYELNAAFALDVTRSGDTLWVQATAQPKYPVFARSPARFYYKVVSAELEFLFDGDGNTTGVVLIQNGIETPGRKVH
jgi:CubicO group peptidase (beta-lactamase class C family)